VEITGDYFYIFKADSADKAREMIKFIQVDYSDSSPLAQFPALKAVKRGELKQSVIREKSSYDARILLSRKVEEKIQQNSEYERSKSKAGTRSRKSNGKKKSGAKN
jgi:hypothetical protein